MTRRAALLTTAPACVVALLFAATLVAPRQAVAQFAPPNQSGVTLAHIHMIVADVEAQKRFWTTAMDGTLLEGRSATVIALPEVFLVLENGQPEAPYEGSVLNHFGFAYKDLPAQVARWREQGIRITLNQNGNQGYVYGPDGGRVEFAWNPELDVPFRMDHLHMFLSDIPAAQAWYAKHFGGVTGQRKRNAVPGMVDCSFFPGTTVSFNPLGRGATAPLAPTKGRGIDHFGFEVKDLKAFVAKLEADGVKIDMPPHVLPNTGIMSAFVTDPWGSRVEITQNFATAGR